MIIFDELNVSKSTVVTLNRVVQLYFDFLYNSHAALVSPSQSRGDTFSSFPIPDRSLKTTVYFSVRVQS